MNSNAQFFFFLYTNIVSVFCVIFHQFSSTRVKNHYPKSFIVKKNSLSFHFCKKFVQNPRKIITFYFVSNHFSSRYVFRMYDNIIYILYVCTIYHFGHIVALPTIPCIYTSYTYTFPIPLTCSHLGNMISLFNKVGFFFITQGLSGLLLRFH